MRKNINKIVGLTLCIGMLTGCAQTPESSLVKPKGNKAEDAYTEAEGVDIVKEDSSENTKDKNTAVRTTIRDLLNAPETYKRDRKSTRLNSSHIEESRMPSSA